MVRHNIRMVLALCGAFVSVAWVALVVSFWLPDPAGQALMATSWAMGIPSLIIGVVGVIFERELVEEFESRTKEVTSTKALRCSDCGSQILNAGGTTIGDQIEEEVLMLNNPSYDEKGNWKPPRSQP